jgi:hypothetical protein
MTDNQGRGTKQEQKTFVTLSGLPLQFELAWPFHASTSGADFHVLHGTAMLMDGGALRAEFAATLTQVIAEALPSLGPEHAEPVVINAVRLAADSGTLEFLKTGKRQPVPISSRHYSFKTRKFRFANPSEPELREFMEHKIFWLGSDAPVWIPDPLDALYLGIASERLLELAGELGQQKLAQVDGEYARATAALTAQHAKFRETVAHSLERAVAKY